MPRKRRAYFDGVSRSRRRQGAQAFGKFPQLCFGVGSAGFQRLASRRKPSAAGHHLPKQQCARQLLVVPRENVADITAIFVLPEDLFASGVSLLAGRRLQAPLTGIPGQLANHVERGRIFGNAHARANAETGNGRAGPDDSLDLIFIQAATGKDGNVLQASGIETRFFCVTPFRLASL